MTQEHEQLDAEERARRFRAYRAQCNGSLHFYRHGMAKRLVYTDGVKEMATLCQAWWLVDAIASYVATTQAVQAEEFQTWTLAMSAGKVSLVCTNGNDEVPIVSQLIGYTDFPFGLLPFKLFCRHSEVAGSMAFVLMLPEEH